MTNKLKTSLDWTKIILFFFTSETWSLLNRSKNKPMKRLNGKNLSGFCYLFICSSWIIYLKPTKILSEFSVCKNYSFSQNLITNKFGKNLFFHPLKSFLYLFKYILTKLSQVRLKVTIVKNTMGIKLTINSLLSKHALWRIADNMFTKFGLYKATIEMQPLHFPNPSSTAKVQHNVNLLNLFCWCA